MRITPIETELEAGRGRREETKRRLEDTEQKQIAATQTKEEKIALERQVI